MNRQITPDDRCLADMSARSLEGPRYVVSPSMLPGVAKCLDVVAGLVAAAAASVIYPPGPEQLAADYVSATVFLIFIFTMTSLKGKMYDLPAIMNPLAKSDNILLAMMTTAMFFLSALLAFHATAMLSLQWLMVFSITMTAATISLRLCQAQLLKRLSARGVVRRNFALLGAGRPAQLALQRISDARLYFIDVAGVYRSAADPPGPVELDAPLLGDTDTLLSDARAGRVDAILITVPWHDSLVLTEAVERLRELPIDVYLASDVVGFELAFRSVQGDLREFPVMEVVQRPITGWSAALKGLEDYIIAGVLCLLLSPLMMLIAIAVKLDSPGPALFRQKRLGFNNKVFEVYKFRSMFHNRADQGHVRQASRGDPRVTRVGRIIRATSLDELPQLFNVLNGTMSIVGPRPHALSHNEEYGRKIRGYFARHRVKPGITGWAQVNGLRGETERLDKMEARIAHDIYYADNWSLLFDLRIMVMTALVVLFQKSAY